MAETELPATLHISTPRGLRQYAGDYALLERRLVNGCPIWGKKGGLFFIHSGKSGHWLVHDNDDFDDDKQRLASSEVHNGRMPHNVSWLRRSQKTWRRDEAVVVTALDRPHNSLSHTEKRSGIDLRSSLSGIIKERMMELEENWGVRDGCSTSAGSDDDLDRSPAHTPRDMQTLTLVRTCRSHHFGLGFAHGEGQRIDQIFPGGLVAQWNEAHPHAVIAPGVKIESVNGVVGPGIHDELHRNDVQFFRLQVS